MLVKQAKSARQLKHHDRATTFYKMVLKWHKEQGHNHSHCRRAAIGLPEAIGMNDAKSHVRQFLAGALKDGMPPKVLVQLTLELVRQKDGLQR